MVDRLVELILNIVLWTAQGISIVYEAKQKTTSKHDSFNRNHSKSSLSQLSSISQYPRAVLIASSSLSFGNACERLVNIAFETSQVFPTMMSTCGNVIEYINNELTKQYPNDIFHIVIGEDHGFGFSIDDNPYFAEILQERYRVLIFSTKQNDSKSVTNHTNHQMKFKWN